MACLYSLAVLHRRSLCIPQTSIAHTIFDHQFSNQLSLHFIYRYGIAKAFPTDSTISFQDLAAKTNTPLHDLKRLVRHAAVTSRIFYEPRKNILAHTAASSLLATDPATQAWTGMTLEEFWPAASRTVDAMVKWPHSQEPTHTGLSIIHGEEKHLFQIVTSDSQRAKRFGAAMASLSSGEGFEIDHLVDGYNWAQFASDARPGRVVDVGGSLGFACIAIAKRFPGLDFVVQDLAKAFVHGDPKSAVPDDVRDRIEFMAHDFFTEQPVKGADVYLIRWCLHNWSDKYAIKILRALVPALKKGARIVVNDGVLPEPSEGGPSWWSQQQLKQQQQRPASAADDQDPASTQAADSDDEVNVDWADEQSMRAMDLIMLEGLNARERDADEWQQLFREADTRFIWKGATRPEGCKMWIMEAEWAG